MVSTDGVFSVFFRAHALTGPATKIPLRINDSGCRLKGTRMPATLIEVHASFRYYAPPVLFQADLGDSHIYRERKGSKQ